MTSHARLLAAALFFVLGNAAAKPTDTTALDYGETCKPTEAMSERTQPVRFLPLPAAAPDQRHGARRSRLPG